MLWCGPLISRHPIEAPSTLLRGNTPATKLTSTFFSFAGKVRTHGRFLVATYSCHPVGVSTPAGECCSGPGVQCPASVGGSLKPVPSTPLLLADTSADRRQQAGGRPGIRAGRRAPPDSGGRPAAAAAGGCPVVSPGHPAPIAPHPRGGMPFLMRFFLRLTVGPPRCCAVYQRR